jgi:hypothetical protein
MASRRAVTAYTAYLSRFTQPCICIKGRQCTHVRHIRVVCRDYVVNSSMWGYRRGVQKMLQAHVHAAGASVPHA